MSPLAAANGEGEASLDRAADELSLTLLPGQRAQLLEYIDLLVKWSQTYNLTSIRDRSGMLSHHVIDCLAVLPSMRREMMGLSAPRVMDAGSGAGLPGVVIGIMEPSWAVTCVDSVGKKTAFVRHVAGSLGLRRVEAEHGRVEDLTKQFDVVVSRAFASLEAFTSRTRSALAEQGKWLAMKGRVPQQEIDALPLGVKVFHVEQIKVPALAAERSLVWMKIDDK
ncbi:MAG TPA: 16S rRNA (guanine(527)-N(7))-methyltransferase RsmG [Caldimonas sp.]|nr:16S rRNA (guanine(527)-N(7))-methyltransferase RsmG [Caldimonas sp.]